MVPRLIALPAVLMAFAPLDAQTSDELFQTARRLAAGKNREGARAACRQALERSPGYHDIRIYLGRLHAWDGQYAEGRAELERVLREEPANLEARDALMDLESWSDHPEAARRVCDAGLALHPGHAGLLLRKARLQKGAGDLDGALGSAGAALEADPSLHAARVLLEDVKELAQRSKVGLDFAYESFNRTFDPWRTTALSFGHRWDVVSVIGRVTRAQRFGAWGTQAEVDAYPHLADGTYAYLNVGRSSDFLFPVWRHGAELYHNFPLGLEGSLGYRHLQFRASNVTIYTGSLGKYYGDYLFTLRLNVTPGQIGSSVSGAFGTRFYLEGPDSYLSFTVSTGLSPDQLSPDAEIIKLRSQKVGLGLQKRLGRRWVVSAGAATERQEIAAGTTRQHLTLNGGVEVRF